MALTTNVQYNSESIVNHASGTVVTDAGGAVDTTIGPVGFIPRVVRWINLTDKITLEWYTDMAANSAIRTIAAGTRSLDVSSGITVIQPGGVVTNAGGFTIKAADIPASKSFAWEAIA